MRFAKKSFVTVTAIGIALCASAAPASAAPRDHVVVSPGQSIQQAIDSISSGGGTVEVLPGVYHENLAIEHDNVRLVGRGVQLVPPDEPVLTPCDTLLNNSSSDSARTASASDGAPALVGICVGGTDTPVRKATVSGFDIEGFAAMGVFVFNGRDTSLTSNTSTGNGGYGLAAFNSSGTRIYSNHVEDNEEAGIYVGDSPNADAAVTYNESEGNGFGIFLRDSQSGRVANNNIHDNCAGILALADAPGPAGDYNVGQNAITHNTKLCPANEEQPFDISGDGVVISGAHDMRIHDNAITQNAPGDGEPPFSGGVVVLTGLGGTPPMNNRVTSNTFVGNSVDINYDGTGTGNKLSPNSCTTSSPPSICS